MKILSREPDPARKRKWTMDMMSIASETSVPSLALQGSCP